MHLDFWVWVHLSGLGLGIHMPYCTQACLDFFYASEDVHLGVRAGLASQAPGWIRTVRVG